MNLEDIERRLRVLEDVEEIKRLKARYCAHCDNKYGDYDPDSIVSLFTEDAVWEGGTLGRSEGKEEIRRRFVTALERIPFSLHMVMNPIVEVDGDTATGTWYLLQACTFGEGNQAVWGSARYDDYFVRVNGEWKIKNLNVNSFFWTPFDQGWVKKRFL